MRIAVRYIGTMLIVLLSFLFSQQVFATNYTVTITDGSNGKVNVIPRELTISLGDAIVFENRSSEKVTIYFPQDVTGFRKTDLKSGRNLTKFFDEKAVGKVGDNPFDIDGVSGVVHVLAASTASKAETGSASETETVDNSGAPQDASSAQSPSIIQISIRDIGEQFEFTPVNPHIVIGDTIVWNNTGTHRRTVRVQDHPNATLSAGESHSVQFAKEGSFNYSIDGADGTITVAAASTKSAATGTNATTPGSANTNTGAPGLYDPDLRSDNPYGGDTLESPRPSDQVASERRLEDLILRIVNWIVTFLGIAGFGYLIYGGFLYVLSGEKEEMATKAKSIFVQVTIGVILVLAAYAIVFTMIGGRGRLFFY